MASASCFRTAVSNSTRCRRRSLRRPGVCTSSSSSRTASSARPTRASASASPASNFSWSSPLRPPRSLLTRAPRASRSGFGAAARRPTRQTRSSTRSCNAASALARISRARFGSLLSRRPARFASPVQNSTRSGWSSRASVSSFSALSHWAWTARISRAAASARRAAGRPARKFPGRPVDGVLRPRPVAVGVVLLQLARDLQAGRLQPALAGVRAALRRLVVVA